MGSRYLVDLADVIRSAGLKVYEESGWETRARSSGGFDTGNPCAIIIHHTASDATRAQDVQYMCYNSSDRPIANLLLDRAGEVTVMGAGATNTNGKGGPLGPLPQDGANSRVIGIEAANIGTGAESWPTVQQNNYQILVNALCDAYNISRDHVYSHAEWAPTRKVDPAGPSRWQSSPASQPWIMQSFRDELKSSPLPPDTPNGTMEEKTSKQWMRDVLNEGAVSGTTGWPETVRNTLLGIQDAVNQILYNGPTSLQYKMDDVLQALGRIEPKIDKLQETMDSFIKDSEL